ncbi:HRQ family protein 1 [Spathaspora passalidarum NRRL Y-27907]|uniref:HRQ family protein 1 n=1 Tax=Spathaspora passalidarum (strain NRRL Y-27907 / 11-Y1) TaxID=619300 RepID=G3AFM2_SPAPN|nr:HRQ family protein 1 [Spathaspora passalidarum NRRL Y-27907]EGW35011.1 HRQ family protein 1 [Spathaspora passalidarum NRRL Y-27907]
MNHSTVSETGVIEKYIGTNFQLKISLIVFIPLVVYLFTRTKSLKPSAEVSNGKTKRYNPNERPLGVWNPDYNFKTPVPEPYPNWDIETTKPLPYRAFRHKYNVTMGLRNMDWSSWIELDNEWPKFHELKLQRLAGDMGDTLHDISPMARDASWELLRELCGYLPHRYPKLFKFEHEVMEILPTGEKFDLNDEKLDPIVTSAKFLQDDIAIVVENDDGAYSLEAGCICLAGFWRLKDKFRMKLDEIHQSGDVPQYDERLKTGMNKFFRRLAVDKPVVRNNYFIQTDNDLAWSYSIGSEKTEKVGWYTAEEATDVNMLYYRSERQSLRRLPISGAVVFTIRTYFIPIAKLCEEPYVPRRLFNGLSSWSDDVGEYKGFHKFKDILLPYLEQKAKEQEANGLDPTKEPQGFPF